MKKAIYLILAVALVFTVMAIPALAADAGKVTVVATPDKTNAEPGDIVTFTISLVNKTGSKIGTAKVNLAAPAGLTLVMKSASAADVELNRDPWEQITFSATNGNMTAVCGAEAAEGENPPFLAKVKYQVDADASEGAKALTLTVSYVQDDDSMNPTNLDTASESNAVTVTKPHVHAPEKVAKVDATCTKEGSLEYWHCTAANCPIGDKKYSDEALTQELTSVVIEKDPHNHTGSTLTETPAVAATCKDDGAKAYWTCSGCNKTFSDAQGKNDLANAPEVVSKDTAEHTFTNKHTAAVTPGTTGNDCLAAGNVEYWECDVCGKKFAADQKTEITDPTVPALEEHTKPASGTVTKEATPTTDGEITYVCAKCGESFTEPFKFLRESLEKITTSEAVKAVGTKSADDVKAELVAEAAKGEGYSEENTVAFEAELLVSVDNGENWRPAQTAAEIGDGVTFTVAYPTGTDQTYDFVVVHMKADGTLDDSVTFEKTADGLKITVKSLSPFAISWKAPASSSGGDSNAAGGGNQPGKPGAPKTGDDTSIALWIVLFGVCALAAGAVVLKKKVKD